MSTGEERTDVWFDDADAERRIVAIIDTVRATQISKADVLRARICRAVCFGVNDDDLPSVLKLCYELEAKKQPNPTTPPEGSGE